MENKNRYLELYIKYDYLTTDNLIEILKPTKEIYSKIWYDIYREEIIKYRKIKNIYPLEPQLVIESIYTGESVNFKLSDSFIPRIKFLRKGDVEVQLPKKMGIVALVGYFTISILTSFSNLAKNVLETQKAYYEKQKAQIEYELKMKELEKLNSQQKAYLDSLTHEQYISIENSCYKIRNVLVRHDNFTHLAVNGIEVYKREILSKEGGWHIIDNDFE